MPLSINKRGNSSHTFLPVLEGELNEPGEQAAPVASATTQGAEIDMHQDNARPSASTTILPTHLAKSVPTDMTEANSEKTNPEETKKS